MTTKTLTKFKSQVLTLVLTIVALAVGQSAWAQDVTGTGAENDPYVVYSWTQLKEKMAEGGYIRLGANVTDPDKSSSSYLSVPSGVTVTLDLAGHTIDRGLTSATSYGYVINLVGTLTINDSSSPSTGTITGGWNSSGYGGGVNISGGGSLTLNAGTISGNKVDRTSGEAKGGGVFVGNNATFTMNGGSITGNSVSTSSSTANGGGVYINSYNSKYGTFNMNGGTISGNNVTGNGSSVQGGGVYIDNRSTVGKFNLSGNCTISSNTVNNQDIESVNNVYVSSSTVINLTAALDASTRIGVTADAGQTVTNGLSGKGILTNFTSDNSVLEIYANEVRVATVEEVKAKAPTCTEIGISQDCWLMGGHYYSDQACTNEINPVIPALGHDMTHHEAMAATADAFGNVEYWMCSRCGKYFLDSEGNSQTTLWDVTTHDYGVKYIDEQGVAQTCTDFTFITSSDEQYNNYGAKNETKWYVVYGEVTINGQLKFLNANTNLILMDGASLTVDVSTFEAIYANDGTLTIYGQSGGTGSISTQSTSSNFGYGIRTASGFTINGGSVTATGINNGIYCFSFFTVNRGSVTATGNSNDGIYANSVTINGGSVTATSHSTDNDDFGINASSITLGWTSPTDRIIASSFGKKYNNCSLNIATGQYLYTGTEVVSGTVTDLTKVNGKTLQPAVKLTLDTGITATGTNVFTQTDGTFALPGATVTLGHGDREGYTFNEGSYTVTDAGSTPVNVTETNDVYSFTMPASDVTVTANFTTIPWAGSGTEDDPYVIQYPSQLDLLATNVNGGESYDGIYFVLANDITYTHTTDWDDATSTENNYTPIGGSYNNSSRSFRGTFDGQGHTISGIRIYRAGNEYVDEYLGLFGSVDDGTVKNVTVSDMRITGYSYVGGIAGENYGGGKIVNCHAIATVTLHALRDGAYNFGGIVGCHYQNNSGGFISGCSSAVTLTVTGSPTLCQAFGGIVGECDGDMRNCLAEGVKLPGIHYHDDNNNNDASGAIAGTMYQSHAITDNYYSGCYLGGTPTASGIGVGYDNNNTYTRHDVTSFEDNSITYTNCAVPAATLRTLTVGTGIYAAGSVIPNANGTYSVIPGTEVTLGYNGMVTTYQLATYSLDGTPLRGNTFTMPDADATAAVNVVTIWNTDHEADGSAEKPFIISTTWELDELARRVNNGTGDPNAETGYNGKYFELGDNITYSTVGIGETESNYAPIGNVDKEFNGNFDGKNKTVSGIRIYRNGDEDVDKYLGLFGNLEDGTVQNVTVSDALITGYSCVGGIVGYNYCGTVKNCLALGVNVTADDYVGAIVGSNSTNTSLGQNYYNGCTVGTATTGIGCNGVDITDNDGAVMALALYDNGAKAEGNATSIDAQSGNTLPTLLYGRTLTKDQWNTLCVPFNLSSAQIENIFGAGTLVKTLSGYANDGTTVTITFASADEIVAGKPYIIMPVNTVANPVFSNVVIDNTMRDVAVTGATFKGTYGPTVLTANDKKRLFLANNKLWYPTADVTVRACRAYFVLDNDVQAREFILDFGDETTGVSASLVNSEERIVNNELWYTLDGRKLSSKPTQKGVYIHGGKKHVIR